MPFIAGLRRGGGGLRDGEDLAFRGGEAYLGAGAGRPGGGDRRHRVYGTATPLSTYVIAL